MRLNIKKNKQTKKCKYPRIVLTYDGTGDKKT